MEPIVQQLPRKKARQQTKCNDINGDDTPDNFFLSWSYFCLLVPTSSICRPTPRSSTQGSRPAFCTRVIYDIRSLLVFSRREEESYCSIPYIKLRAPLNWGGGNFQNSLLTQNLYFPEYVYPSYLVIITTVPGAPRNSSGARHVERAAHGSQGYSTLGHLAARNGTAEQQLVKRCAT